MTSPRQGFTPINSSNVFTSTIQDETSFSSYAITPRQLTTPPRDHDTQLDKIDEQFDESLHMEADAETYRDIIKQLSTQLQMTTLENRAMKDKLNLYTEETNEQSGALYKQNDMLQETNFKLQEKINQLFIEIQQCQEMIVTKDSKINELKHLIQTSVDQGGNQKLSHLLEENTKLIQIIETQQSEIQLQKEVLEQYEKAYNDQKQQKKEEQQKPQKDQQQDKKDSELLKSEVEMYKAQNSQLQEQIILWNSRYQAVDMNYQIQYQDLLQKMSYLQSELGESQKALTHAQEQHSRKQQQYVTQMQELKVELKLEQGKKHSNPKTEHLEEQIDDLQKQVEYKKSQVQQLQSELLQQQEFYKQQLRNQQESKKDILEDVESKYLQKYEARVKQLENQYASASVSGNPQATSVQKMEPRFEVNYYNRQSDSTRMKLFSERKDNNYRSLYSYTKENVPELKTNYEFSNKNLNGNRKQLSWND